jgi:hypothetical protein
MGFHKPDDDINTVILQAPRPAQHCIGFANAGGCSQENSEFTPAVFLRQG